MPTTLRFTKIQATGRDAVVWADPDGAGPLSPQQLALVCDRRFGVGADVAIRAVRAAAVHEAAGSRADDEGVEWFVDARAASGAPADLTGDDLLAFARFVTERGLADLPMGETLALATRHGVRDVQRGRAGFHVDLGRWRLGDSETLVRAKNLPVARPGLSIELGAPHVVVALADEHELEAVDLAYVPVLDPERADAAHVEFVVPHDPLVVDGVGRISIRVHERAVGEALCHGTGAVAAALATRHWAGPRAPHEWRVDVPGGRVWVRMFAAEDGEHVALAGPAEIVFDGEISLQ